MPRVVTIPADTDLLCEGCGYVLNGLPDAARCPECGKPAIESDADLRQPPAWEAPAASQTLAFLDTTARISLRPRRFFRNLSVRSENARSLQFARLHWGVAAILFGSAALAHLDWFITLGGSRQLQIFGRLPLWAGFVVGTYLFLRLTTRLAASLTTWEAAYRGLRLPLPVVMRALHYHAAHYLPVGVLAAGTVLGYQLALANRWVAGDSGPAYLYVLSAEVVVAAGYLFSTYWTAMRNLMYGNG